MGMEVTQTRDQLCFSIDSESTFSTYQDIIEDFDEAKIDALANKYSFRDVLYSPGNSGSRNQFAERDPLYAMINGQALEFPLPRPGADGHCNTMNSVAFLAD